MKIGELVKAYARQVFAYCETVDHGEIDSLLDPDYSKRTFGINFPYCAEVDAIEQSQSRRYWTEVYMVRGRRVRVTSQWYPKNADPFIEYLVSKGIADAETVRGLAAIEAPAPRIVGRRPAKANARYRGNAIGNAQNLFVRNVLSNLGNESFSQRDWEATKDYFGHRCAYCGAESDKLVMEHAIPINKVSLGEHRLGNLVPSCKACNDAKGDKDYRQFLGDNAAAIERIDEYMDSRNYVPLADNEQVTMVLNMAHKEVATLAERYVRILNELFVSTSTEES